MAFVHTIDHGVLRIIAVELIDVSKAVALVVAHLCFFLFRFHHRGAVTLEVKARKVRVKGPRGALKRNFGHIACEYVLGCDMPTMRLLIESALPPLFADGLITIPPPTPW